MQATYKFILAALTLSVALGAGLVVHAQEITVGFPVEASQLDPQARDSQPERWINSNIYESLMFRTAAGKLVPGLAVDYPKKINKLTWQFTLRKNIKFHNGEPFNADSVVASVSRWMDPDYNSEMVSYTETITKAKRESEYVVRISTKTPDPLLPTRMYWMKMVPKKYTKNAEFPRKPIGTGPYKFSEWKRGSTITLVSNENYWRGAPAVKKITYRFIPESSARMAGLIAGELDIISSLLPEFKDLVPAWKAVEGLESGIVILNTYEGVTADVRVRQALNYAVDKKSLVRDLYQGLATVNQGQLAIPSYFGYNPAVKAYPYDLAKAKRLMKEAGAVGKTVRLTGQSGRWLKDREVIEAVAHMWEKTGIKVDLRIYDYSEWLTRLFQKKRPQAIFFFSSNELMDVDRSFSAYLHMNGRGASNKDKINAELIDEAHIQTNEKKRVALYHKAIKRQHDQAFMVWLINANDVWGMSKRIKWQPRVDAQFKAWEISFK